MAKDNQATKLIRSPKLEQIANGVHFGAASGAIFEVSKKSVEPDAIHPNNITGKAWAYYGKNNDLPQQIVDRNGQDPTSSNAIQFKIKAHYCLGLMPYRKIKEGAKIIKDPVLLESMPEVEDFYYRSDLDNYIQGVISDIEWFNHGYSELIKAAGKDKIAAIAWQKVVRTRAEKLNPATGRIDNYYISGAWPSPKSGEYARVPAFDKLRPFENNKALFCHKIQSVDKEYYPAPAWYSNAKALEVSSEIFTWILANLKNAVNIKYHIKIPQSYFENLFPAESYESDAERLTAMAAHEKELKGKMDEMLAGSKNASKTFYSKFAVDELGKPLPGWEIIAIDNKTNHEAFLPAYNTSAMAVSTAHNVDPTMTGIQLSTGPNGSGSDVREKFNTHVQLHTVIPRQTSLEALNLVSRLNKWGIQWDFENIILNTIDKAKSGFETGNEVNPTTDQK